MGQYSQELETVVSNKFLTDKEFFQVLELKNKSFHDIELEKIKKRFTRFFVLILKSFRDEKDKYR